MGHVLKINPVFKEMIWGGHKLRDVYGYDIPSDNTGECWAISAHKNGDCTISDGEFAGKTLSSLWDEHRELFANIEGDQFPLLVKIIDACNDLSVQVHPNDEYAKAHENSLGKTECWYVLNTDEGTKMVMGHHAKTKEELVKAIENDDYDNLLNKFDIKEGDFFLHIVFMIIIVKMLKEMNVNCMYNNRLMLQQFHMFHLRRIVWLKQQLKMERGRSWYQVNFLQLINTK